MDREEIPPEGIQLNPTAKERTKTSPTNALNSSPDEQRCELKKQHVVPIVVIISIFSVISYYYLVGNGEEVVSIGNGEEGMQLF